MSRKSISARAGQACLIALALTCLAPPALAQQASTGRADVIWLGEYAPGAYPTRLHSGMPFSDSQDPPGPGANVAQPLSALRPWGFLRDRQFVAIGAPLRDAAMNAFGKALTQCATARPDARSTCRLAVAEGKFGYDTQGLHELAWYCGARRIDARDATAAFQDSADGIPTDVPVHDLALAATSMDCGKPNALGFMGDPAVPVSTSPQMRNAAFQPLEDAMPAGQVDALRRRLWPLARRALVEATRAQLANAASLASYDKRCRQSNDVDREVHATPISDIARASLDDVVRSGTQVARAWQAAEMDDKHRLIFVSLWANVLLPGVTRGNCPATVKANAWIADDGAHGKLLRNPATLVSQPDALLRFTDRIYVVNMVFGTIDVGTPPSDENPSPRLSIEQLTPEGLQRLGYPGYGPGEPRPENGLPLGYRH